MLSRIARRQQQCIGRNQAVTCDPSAACPGASPFACTAHTEVADTPASNRPFACQVSFFQPPASCLGCRHVDKIPPPWQIPNCLKEIESNDCSLIAGGFRLALSTVSPLLLSDSRQLAAQQAYARSLLELRLLGSATLTGSRPCCMNLLADAKVGRPLPRRIS